MINPFFENLGFITEETIMTRWILTFLLLLCFCKKNAVVSKVTVSDEKAQFSKLHVCLFIMSIKQFNVSDWLLENE